MMSWPLWVGSVAGTVQKIPEVIIDPAILAMFNGGANVGTMINPNDRGTVFKNSAGTLVAEPGDYVELILDQSGNGNHLHAVIDSAVDYRPKLAEDSSGLRYLDFTAHTSPGATSPSYRYCYFSGNALMTSSLSVFIDATATSGCVTMACPQLEGVHNSPYFRWSFWGGPKLVATRLNGSETFWSNVRDASVDRIPMGLDTVNGKFWSDGYAVATVTPVSLTYPNISTTHRVYINRTGAGTERSSSQKSGAIFGINRGLSNAEVAAVNAWLRHSVI